MITTVPQLRRRRRRKPLSPSSCSKDTPVGLLILILLSLLLCCICCTATTSYPQLLQQHHRILIQEDDESGPTTNNEEATDVDDPAVQSPIIEEGIEKEDPLFCTEDVQECSDGTFVSRNPNIDCDFDPCLSYDADAAQLLLKKEEGIETLVVESTITEEDEEEEVDIVVDTESNEDELPSQQDDNNSNNSIIIKDDNNIEESVIVEASDGISMEETDVQEAADELSSSALEEEVKVAAAEVAAEASSSKETDPATTTLTTSSSSSSTSSSNTIYTNTDSHRSAWVTHGIVGTLIFGLLLPTSISSALFRNTIPQYWIYIHVSLNVLIFAMTFFTVGIAFTNLGGIGITSEGHFKELHHIVGLLLLMIVSFQVVNGFLRPPREFITDDEHDQTPGAILRSTINDKSMTARTLWCLVHSLSGLAVFGLGVYQVQSGLGLFSLRYNTTNWGNVYVGYACWLVGMIVVAKVWMKWKGYERKKKNLSLEMGRGSDGAGFLYDAEGDLTLAQFETV